MPGGYGGTVAVYPTPPPGVAPKQPPLPTDGGLPGGGDGDGGGGGGGEGGEGGSGGGGGGGEEPPNILMGPIVPAGHMYYPANQHLPDAMDCCNKDRPFCRSHISISSGVFW